MLSETMPRLEQPLAIETISSMWSLMHQDADFSLTANSAFYLSTLAVVLDDDLASLLLLKKLKLAREHGPEGLPRDVIAMSSFFEFQFDNGAKQLGRLLYSSSAERPHSLSISTRLGLGLIGMRSGQRVLWPDSDGALRELQVHGVQQAVL
jgi:hypothetical protein